jgi:hypothetical protein
MQEIMVNAERGIRIDQSEDEAQQATLKFLQEAFCDVTGASQEDAVKYTVEIAGGDLDLALHIFYSEHELSDDAAARYGEFLRRCPFVTQPVCILTCGQDLMFRC